MPRSDLTTSAENYLKVIWSLSEWSDEPVTVSRIAEHTGLRLSSVSDGIRRLVAKELLHHAPYGSIELTDTGRAHALDVVRRHRLLEAFLVSTLGYTWDEVHDEAEDLEHAVSDRLIDRIDALLGRPERDPHGDPIPSADGTIRLPDARPLSADGVAGRVVVERISDRDPELLKHLAEYGITVGTELEVTPGAPFSDSLVVVPRCDCHDEPISLGRAAADALFVSSVDG